MSIFDRFPHSGLHELNLDWIISKIRDLGANVDNLSKTVSDISGEIEDSTLRILERWLDDGTLADILNHHILNMKTYQFPSFNEIPDTIVFSVGETIVTGGFLTANDGGSGRYIVSNSGITHGSYSFIPVSWESYKSWGLYGDGLHDDSVALQLYINLSPYVFLGDGSFVIASTINLKSNSKIVGNSATVSISNNIAGDGFVGDSITNLIVEGVNFNGGIPNQTRKILSITNSNNIYILNCGFTGGLGYAMRFSGNSKSTIYGCSFNNINGVTGDPGGGIYIQGGDTIKIHSCMGSLLRDHLIYLDGSVEIGNVDIADIYCTDTLPNPLTNAAAIAVYGNSHDFIISGCRLLNTRTGIELSDRNGYTPNNYSICDILARTDINCISVINSSSNVGVSNGSFSNLNLKSAAQDCISIRYVKNICATGVLLNGAGRDGVEGSGCENIRVSGVTAFGTFAELVQFGGRGNVKNVTVDGIYNCGTVSGSMLFLKNATNCEYRDIRNNGVAGYVIGNTTDATIQNCNLDSIRKPSVFYSATIPSSITGFSNYSQKGDICYDSSGNTNGWKCTVSGNPGTWTAM